MQVCTPLCFYKAKQRVQTNGPFLLCKKDPTFFPPPCFCVAKTEPNQRLGSAEPYQRLGDQRMGTGRKTGGGQSKKEEEGGAGFADPLVGRQSLPRRILRLCPPSFSPIFGPSLHRRWRGLGRDHNL